MSTSGRKLFLSLLSVWDFAGGDKRSGSARHSSVVKHPQKSASLSHKPGAENSVGARPTSSGRRNSESFPDGGN
jgi:hypothetical protein